MSTFNISQKIGGGGVFSKTTGGSTVILTTTANQYAKVKIAGDLDGAGGGAVCAVSIGGIVQRQATAGSSATSKLYGTSEPVELLVPPSSSLSINNTLGGGGANVTVVGSYVIIENTL